MGISKCLHLLLLFSAALSGTIESIKETPANDAAPVVESVAAPVLVSVADEPLPTSSWMNTFSEKKKVKGYSSAASKGVGTVESSSGWGGAQSHAQGSEGSITNSGFKANADDWGSSWARRKDGSAKESWAQDFSTKGKVNALAKSAHQGSGGSSSSASMKSSGGNAQGSQGAAVDSSFKKNADNWATSWGKKSSDGKSISFSQDWADKKSGSSSSRVIGYGTATASGKSTINKSMVEGEGQAGAQSSTKSIFNGDAWNKAWGVEKNGKKNQAFKNDFSIKTISKGNSTAFGVGDAAVKGLTSVTAGSKSVAKGQSGSGSNSFFKGNRDSWTDAWSTINGKKIKYSKVGASLDGDLGDPSIQKSAAAVSGKDDQTKDAQNSNANQAVVGQTITIDQNSANKIQSGAVEQNGQQIQAVSNVQNTAAIQDNIQQKTIMIEPKVEEVAPEKTATKTNTEVVNTQNEQAKQKEIKKPNEVPVANDKAEKVSNDAKEKRPEGYGELQKEPALGKEAAAPVEAGQVKVEQPKTS